MQKDSLHVADASGGDADVGSDLRAAFGRCWGRCPGDYRQDYPRREGEGESRGTRGALATVRPAATVQAKEGTRPRCWALSISVLGIARPPHILGLAGLLRGMLSWCRITALHLCHVMLSMADVEELVAVLGQCGSLAHLDLRSSRIGDQKAVRLAGVLGQCGSLAHLDLGRNSIGAEGVGRLAGVLGQCGSLAHLDLGFNSIGDEGARRLAGCSS